MRNVLLLFIMLPAIIGTMFIWAILVGVSVTLNCFELDKSVKELPRE